MENWGSYFSNASNGSGHQKLDLTLRLGLPCQDSHVEVSYTLIDTDI